jgi:hypothetical protein
MFYVVADRLHTKCRYYNGKPELKLNKMILAMQRDIEKEFEPTLVVVPMQLHWWYVL